MSRALSPRVMKKMPEQELTFWGHLDALRSVVVRIALVVITLACVFFAFMPWLFDHVITAPCQGDFPVYRALSFVRGDGSWMPDMSDSDFHVELINIELASQFMVHMSASMWAAFIVAFPVVIYMLWGFVAPGLYESEKREARKAFVFGNLMFYVGMAVAYFVVFPLALRFLADYRLSDKIANTVSLTSYMDTFYMMLLVIGALFELPLVAWLLGKMGIISRAFFGRYRRHAVCAILVVSAVLTPTSDVFTLLLVFLPVYALWEGSALLVPARAADAVTQS